MQKQLRGLLESDRIFIHYGKETSHLEIKNEDDDFSMKVIDFHIEINNSVKSVRDDPKMYVVDFSTSQRIELIGNRKDIFQFLEFVKVENPSKFFDWNGPYDNLIGIFVVIQFIVSLLIIDNRGRSWPDFYLDIPSLLISIIIVVYTYFVIAKLSLKYMERRHLRIRSISEEYETIKVIENQSIDNRNSFIINILGVIVLIISILLIIIYFNPVVLIYNLSIFVVIFILNKY